MRVRTTWMDGCRRMVERVRNVVRNRRANVLMIVGLSAPLVFGSAGFAVDYGYASYLKRALDQASDAASLAATSQSAAAAGGGYTNTSNLKTYGVNTFNGNTSKLNVSLTQTQICPADPLSPPSGSWCMIVNPNGTGGVVAETKYAYNVPTYFSSLLGIPTIPIAGSATATANPITYIDYYILLDISQSMGIGATTGDMTNMFSRSLKYNNDGCVFGCHVQKSKSGGGTEPYANEDLAHNSAYGTPITLRIDSAVAAIKNIITDAQNAAGSAKNIRISIYTMSDDPNSGKQLNFIKPSANALEMPSSDYNGLYAAASAITLGGNQAGGLGDTNYSTQMSQFNAKIPVNGSGITASSAKQYIFIVSDGAADVNTPNQCYYGHCTAAFDPSNCTSLQAKGAVGTIYTTYLPIYNNNDSTQGYQGDYQSTVYKFSSNIAPNMQSCASNSGLYYEASNGPAIDAAMKALFASTLKTARLTQ